MSAPFSRVFARRPTSLSQSASGRSTSQSPQSPQQLTQAGTNLPAQAEGMSTPVLLGWARFITVIVCLAAGVAAVVSIQSSSRAVVAINSATQQMAKLQLVRGDLDAAQGAVTGALARNPTAPGEEYVTRLADAGQHLSEAAANAEPAQGRQIAQMARGVSGFAVSLGSAANQMSVNKEAGADQFQAARLGLGGDVSQPGSELYVYYDKQNLAAQPQTRWVSALLSIPILVLVAASVVHARRTRRILNLGLLVAVAAMSVTWYAVDQSLGYLANMVDASRAGPQSETVSIAGVYAAVSSTRALEGLQAISHRVDLEEGNFQDALGEARDMAAGLGYPKPVLQQLDDYEKAHNLVTAALDGNGDLRATTVESERLATKLTNDMSKRLGDSSAQLATMAASQTRSNDQVSAVVAGLCLVAAIAAGVGLSRPLRRYR